MSSILDALKKLEEEKAARKAEAEGYAAFEPESPMDEMMAEPPVPRRHREEVRMTPRMLLIGVALMSLLLVIISVSVSMALVRGGAPATQVAHTAVPAPETSAPASAAPAPTAVASPVPAAPAPPIAASSVAPVHETEPGDAAPAPPAPKPASAAAKVEAAPKEDAPENPAPRPEPEDPPAPKPEPEPEPKAEPAPERVQVARTEVALPEPAAAPKVEQPAPAPEPEPEPEPEPAPAPVAEEEEPLSLEAKDVAPVGDLKELPVLRTSDRISYGLENMRVNFLRESTANRPTAMAVINLNKIHIGEVIPNTKARLIAVERDGIGIEMADTGKRFYVPL